MILLEDSRKIRLRKIIQEAIRISSLFDSKTTVRLDILNDYIRTLFDLDHQFELISEIRDKALEKVGSELNLDFKRMKSRRDYYLFTKRKS